MLIDLYTKVVLSIIAASLLLLALDRVFTVRAASAQVAITCVGDLKANAAGGIEPKVGGYRLQVRCG